VVTDAKILPIAIVGHYTIRMFLNANVP